MSFLKKVIAATKCNVKADLGTARAVPVHKIVAGKSMYFHGSYKDHGDTLKVEPLGSSFDDDFADNLFGGVFLSSEKLGHIGRGKNYWYGIELAESDILPVSEIDHANRETVKDVLGVEDDISEEDLEAFVDILSSSGPGIDEEEAEALFVTHDLVSSSESHNWSWIQQAMQGQIAKRLGKKAAEMEDERGTVLLLPGPAVLRKVSPA